MQLRKVAELPPQERSSKYDEIIAQVKAEPDALFVLDTSHVKNVGQLAQQLKNQFNIKAEVRNGELFLSA